MSAKKPTTAAAECPPTALAGRELAPIEYTVSFPAPHEHYVEVTAIVPTDGAASVELMMPVWTPGSYMVREYARHVEELRAASLDGRALVVAKERKNHWRVLDTSGLAQLVVRYRVYGREMTVRNNWIERDFALLNGAPTFLTVAGTLARRHDVLVQIPRAWKRVVTALAMHRDESRHHFAAPDYDTLVDSPILAGNFEVAEVVVGGKTHQLAHVDGAGVWDVARTSRDVEAIVRTQERFWGALPYDRYVVMNLLTGGGGGLEHKGSTVLMGSRWATRNREDYLGWLGLFSHEFFHAWNVKRLRPVALGPFDYDNEVYTRSLWIAEGFTSYYDDLLVHRAGLTTRDEYLKLLSKTIEKLLTTPGRRAHPMSEASYDAWIKLYRPDENTSNTSISYYIKGAVVALLLDLTIREATQGAKSLDDVMRTAYARYSGDCGYTEEQFRAIVSEVAGRDLTGLIARAVDTTDELELEPALAWVGLRFKPEAEKKKLDGPAATDPWAEPDAGYLGFELKNDAGRNVVSKVLRESPAHIAGINVDDELVAIDELRIRAGDLDARLARYKPGDRLRVLVARRDQMLTLDVVLTKKPRSTWELEVSKDASPEQQQRLAAWLQSPLPPTPVEAAAPAASAVPTSAGPAAAPVAPVAPALVAPVAPASQGD